MIIILIIKILLISLSVASISYTVTKTKIFLPLRKKTNWYILQCPYCLSHWISLYFIAISGLKLYNNLFIDIILFTFSIITLSSIFIGQINKTYEFMINDD